MNLEEYNLAKKNGLNSKIDELKLCKNLDLTGELTSMVGTIGAYIISRNEAPNTLARYTLTSLVIFGITMTVLNAKEYHRHNKQLKLIKESTIYNN